MPRNFRIPSDRLHKPSGQGVVTIYEKISFSAGSTVLFTLNQ